MSGFKTDHLLVQKTYCNLKEVLSKCNEDSKFDRIRELGVNTKSIDGKQVPILHLAVEFDWIHVVKYLIDNEVDVRETDAEGNCVLHVIARCKNQDIVHMVQEIWSDSNLGWMPLNHKKDSPICCSLFEKNELAIETLLRKLKPDDLRGAQLLHIPIQQKFHAGLEHLIDWQRKTKISPLILACGTNLNPLQEAIQVEDSKAMTILFQAKDHFDDWEIMLNEMLKDLAKCDTLDLILSAWNYLTGKFNKNHCIFWNGRPAIRVLISNRNTSIALFRR